MTLDESRELLLAPLRGHAVYVPRLPGNTGDKFITAGTLTLLREAGIEQRDDADTVLIDGCGGWCETFCSMPARVRRIEATGLRVVIFPSTFDTSVAPVREFLETTRATIFARERVSQVNVSAIRPATLAHCPSFFAPLPECPYNVGTLDAFRTDKEASGLRIPPLNFDVSIKIRNLETWLNIIAAHRVVRTDRAHVMIAAARLNKRVEYRDCSYFKVRALAETWLRDFDVHPIA